MNKKVIFFVSLGVLVIVLIFRTGPDMKEADHSFDFRSLRGEMVTRQIRSRGIKDERVLRAMEKVPRHLFVPPYLQDSAYADGPLPIGHGQTISQPYIVALMTEALDLKEGERVLEVGTGSGYQAAILAELGGDVYTIEILEPLVRSARERLLGMGYENIHFKQGDGWLGWPEEAPFDKIVVTAAPEEMPPVLLDQLKEGGKMVIPVGETNDTQMLIIGAKEGGILKTLDTVPVRFVPLVRGTSKDGEKSS